MYAKCIKRFFDITVASALLLFSLPLMVMIAGCLLFANSGKVFFRQQRPGWQGKPFLLYKFRTMNDARDVHGLPLPDEDRLTGIGKLIRKTSLDELPQLYNVLRGDLSLVGPRPLLMEYLPLYTPEQARRHEVKPGLTGWAQINGRNTISWEQKFQYDVWYVENLSFRLDMKILASTIVLVLSGAGVNSIGHTTAPQFEGQQL